MQNQQSNQTISLRSLVMNSTRQEKKLPFQLKPITFGIYEPEEICVGKIDENGEVIQCSETVERSNHPGEDESYNRKPHWKREDILKFYCFLAMYGTDFTMLEKCFMGKRTRKQLIARFKLESKIRPTLISKAMTSSLPLDQLKRCVLNEFM